MAALEKLAALAGDWQATYKLRGDPSFESDTTTHASVTSLVGGRFVRIDYTWDEEDVLKENGPQEGSLLVGFEDEPAPGIATIAWIDGWHNGGRIMVSAGWSMTMYNTTPDGEEALAVSADYSRPD